jgi:hypothetical protein
MVQLHRDMQARKSITSFTARVAPISRERMSLSGRKFMISPGCFFTVVRATGALLDSVNPGWRESKGVEKKG